MNNSLTAITTLKLKINENNIDLSVLNGFITSFKEKYPHLAKQFIDKAWENQPNWRFIVFKLLETLDLDEEHRRGLIIDKDCPIASLQVLIKKYPLFKEDDVDKAIEFSGTILKSTTTSMKYAALYLLSRCFDVSLDNRYNNSKQKLKRICCNVINKIPLCEIYAIQSDCFEYWVKIIQGCLEKYPTIVPIIKLEDIIEKIIDLFNQANFIDDNICKALNPVIKLINSNDKKKSCLLEICKALTSPSESVTNNALAFCVKNMEMNDFICNQMNTDQLRYWYKACGEKVIKVIAQTLPLITADGNSWNQLAINFFECFGDDLNNDLTPF